MPDRVRSMNWNRNLSADAAVGDALGEVAAARGLALVSASFTGNTTSMSDTKMTPRGAVAGERDSSTYTSRSGSK